MRNILVLNKVFRDKVEELISKCAVDGTYMVPFETVRTPAQQARLWRQSRSTAEIRQEIHKFMNEGAMWLAEVLDKVGPQYGRWVTNALPGFSWHQWGEAIDCFSLRDGKANWDANHMDYNIYARDAEQLKLVPGHYWKCRDSVHVQLRPGEVLDYYSIQEVNSKMANSFGRGKRQCIE